MGEYIRLDHRIVSDSADFDLFEKRKGKKMEKKTEKGEAKRNTPFYTIFAFTLVRALSLMNLPRLVRQTPP